MKKHVVLSLILFMAGRLALAQLQFVNMQVNSKWPQDFNGITKINVYWENPSSNTFMEQEWVKQALEESWSKYANIDFVGWTPYDNSGNGIRIFIDDLAHPHTTGLGTQLNGVYQGMVLSFNFLGEYKCSYSREFCIKAIAVHEFGHALGIAHEQEREDCQCDPFPLGSTGGGGGYYVTPCDLSSIMNYCNPNWNNKGELSKYDIEGIQALYGARKESFGFNELSGFTSATNKLGDHQVWENLNVTIGDLQLIYNVNESNREEIKTFRFANSGLYPYTASSVSYHKDGRMYFGSGSGSLYIDNTKNYTIGFFARDNSFPNFELYLTATDVSAASNIVLQGLNQNPRTDKSKMDTEKLMRNGQKPVSLLILNSVNHEKFYVYPDGAIMVYNTIKENFFICGQKQAPQYKDWNGISWAWSFFRQTDLNMTEVYSVSIAGEVWALDATGTFSRFGYVTYPDL